MPSSNFDSVLCLLFPSRQACMRHDVYHALNKVAGGFSSILVASAQTLNVVIMHPAIVLVILLVCYKHLSICSHPTGTTLTCSFRDGMASLASMACI